MLTRYGSPPADPERVERYRIAGRDAVDSMEPSDDQTASPDQSGDGHEPPERAGRCSPVSPPANVRLVDASTARDDVGVALAAAAAGAQKVRAAFGGPVDRHGKGGDDFATQADLDAEAAMMAVIAAARPDDGRVGEESGVHPGTNSRRWLVDPLCGTANFAAHTPLVAVNVALLDGESTVAAVSVDPIADEVFWTDGTQAYLTANGPQQQRLRPASATRIVEVNCDGPTTNNWVGPQVLNDPGFRSSYSPRVLSTTLAVAWTAAGRRAGYISDGRFVANLHFAAGIAICRASGCIVTDLAGGDLERGRGLIVAADQETHDRLVDIVAPHLAAVIP